MSGTTLLLRMSGRRLVPLLMFGFAVLLIGLRYQFQLQAMAEDVHRQEVLRLRERLSVDQARLDIRLGLEDRLMVRRLVGTLAMHDGVAQAYLVGPGGDVLASLSRRDLGRQLDDVLAERPEAVDLRPLQRAPVLALDVRSDLSRPVLLAAMPLQSGHRLLVRHDISRPLALRRAQVQRELALEALAVLAGTAVLALMLHLLWFRRASRLAEALAAMGAGDLSVRAGLQGRDELAYIARVADRMAGQLQQDRDRLRQMSDLVNRSPAVVIEWANEPGWPVRQVSEGIRQWGYEPRQLLGGELRYIDLLHPDDRGAVNAEVVGFLRNGPDHYRQDYRIRRADGAWAWVEDRTVLTRGEDGRVSRISGVLLDITAQKAAEAALQLERARLDEAQAVAHIGSWSVACDTGEVSWSNHHFRVLGLEPGQVTPGIDSYLAVVHPDEVDQVRAHVENTRTLTATEVRLIVHRIITPQGVRHVEERAHGERDAQGRLVRIYGTTMDVTERMMAEQVLLETKDMLEQAESVSLLGSWAGDAQTQRLVVSDQFFRNLGLEPAAQPPSEQVYLDRLHPEDRAEVLQELRSVRAGGPVRELVLRTNPDHGPVRWLRRTARRIGRDAEGLQPRYIGTLHDITDIRRVEEQLRQANQELELRVAERTTQLRQANQELEAFSYSVSHDLKAPLRGIDGYSQLLVEDFGPQLGETGRDFVLRIRQGVELMGTLISDLLDYSRMERRDMAREPVELLPLLEGVMRGYEADIRTHGVQVRMELEPVTLSVDREGMGVVLRNLIGNAIKFSRDRQPPVLELGSRREADHLVLWVRDNGVGFDMKYHERIFSIFQRLHRAEEFPGTGVGLALVSKALQRMGGRVWADSTPGHGATFFLELPA